MFRVQPSGCPPYRCKITCAFTIQPLLFLQCGKLLDFQTLWSYNTNISNKTIGGNAMRDALLVVVAVAVVVLIIVLRVRNKKEKV